MFDILINYLSIYLSIIYIYIYIYINDALSCFNFVIVVKEDTSPNKEDELRYLIKSTLFSSTTC